jgi:hypothetical protein
MKNTPAPGLENLQLFCYNADDRMQALLLRPFSTFRVLICLFALACPVLMQKHRKDAILWGKN